MEASGLPARLRASKLRGEFARVAATIAEQLHKVAFLSGPELAKECSVSVSTITRFAQRLGYSGFPELKRDLEQLYRETTTPYEMFQSFAKGAREDQVLALSIARDLKNIESMKANLDERRFEEAATLIREARVVHLAAIASAEILVDYMYALLAALGKSTTCLKSIGISKRAELIDFDSDHVLVGFSFQRILREVRDLFPYVRRHGVKTIAITDSPINALAQEADVALVAPVIGAAFGLSHAAPLVMINALSNRVAAADKQRSSRALRKAKAEWEKRPIFCESKQGGGG
jgi:DNA-binding MurR/RpiR family transcriptional regulator